MSENFICSSASGSGNCTKIITTYLDPQAMKVALRSDFPWGRMGKESEPAVLAWCTPGTFWHDEEGCSTVVRGNTAHQQRTGHKLEMGER